MRVLQVALVGAVLAVPLAASAVELGKLTVHSAQGQPLEAEIEIEAEPGETPRALTARLAPPSAYRGAGLAYLPELQDVRLTVERRAEGRQVIKLAGRTPLNRSYVDIVVELGAPGAPVRRAYTFLLDPPGPVPPPAVAAAAPPPAEPAPAAAPQPITLPAPSTPAAEAPAPPASAPGAYTVQRGDTLAGIARAHAVEGVTLSQMLVALLRANEAAFIERNINLVRTGETLTIPDAQAAAAVSPQAADEAVAAQMREYDAYRQQLAERVAAGRAAAASRAAGAIAPPAPPGAAPPAQARDALRLSRADAAGGGATARADDNAALDQAIREANERIAQLERNLSDMRRLLELKNQQLAQMQAQSEAAAARTRSAAAEAEFRRTTPCPATGKLGDPCAGYVVVHVVPLCAGGANAPGNMQWMTAAAARSKAQADEQQCKRARS